MCNLATSLIGQTSQARWITQTELWRNEIRL
jgi:hypothetical protein